MSSTQTLGRPHATARANPQPDECRGVMRRAIGAQTGFATPVVRRSALSAETLLPDSQGLARDPPYRLPACYGVRSSRQASCPIARASCPGRRRCGSRGKKRRSRKPARGQGGRGSRIQFRRVVGKPIWARTGAQTGAQIRVRVAPRQGATATGQAWRYASAWVRFQPTRTAMRLIGLAP